jgi:hypothetical protein
LSAWDISWGVKVAGSLDHNLSALRYWEPQTLEFLRARPCVFRVALPKLLMVLVFSQTTSLNVGIFERKI